jgi:nucleoid-associated protein YgaU
VRTEEHYLVKKGDCLWAIAARKRVFGDPFAWPLLYRENRDQIQDPDLIYARQSLNYSHEASSAELKEARAAAAAAPPYHPHPKELPVQ